jgi:glycosyltransferase involved in cell wall biosynthesis
MTMDAFAVGRTPSEKLKPHIAHRKAPAAMVAKRMLMKGMVSAALDLHWLLLRLFSLLAGTKLRAHADRPQSILLTGMYHSESWILSKLRPMAASRSISKIVMVGTAPIPALDKVQTIVAPRWLRRLIGATPARLLTFFVTGLRWRPDWVGGFHILPNGLAVALLARLIRARAVYFNGGGPREVEGGGYLGNAWATLLGGPDPRLERKLIRAVSAFDLIVVRGNATSRYFRERGLTNRFEAIPGGIEWDASRFVKVEKAYDVIFVGRLVQVKRVDIFLQVVADLTPAIPTVRALIVGTGPLLEPLQQQARDLGIAENVTFAGFQKDVAACLCRSRVFMLTSDSEGLSQALIEAMCCGLPCVVSDVGELAEVVEHGSNGYLVKERKSAAFTDCLKPLLLDASRLQSMGEAARQTAAGLNLDSAAQRWDQILGGFPDVTGR